MIRAFCADLLPEFDRGTLRPLKEAAAAQERMRANHHFGKIVLVP